MQEALLGWYRKHRRKLPWRGSQSAYRIFLAEMMLQQTQVERVIPKYHAFLAHFPTIRRLAAAPLAEVIRLWAGLGYNRRAVHLHRAAQAVVREHRGKFPMSLKTLLELPGVGAYTARALLSFAANAPVAVVDTNVRRVLGRVFQHDLTAHYGDKGPTARQFQALADSLIPAAHSARWNQALMDLGSAICAARQPDCDRCPFFAWCQARRSGRGNRPAVAAAARAGEVRWLKALLPGAHNRRPAGTSARQRNPVHRVGRPRPRPGRKGVAGKLAVGVDVGPGARRACGDCGRSARSSPSKCHVADVRWLST